ncbi:nucleotidyltransferase domain-containing protein [Cellulomonas wangsupingiae]|uniref:Nucleotidyltransferase domain-containing protein n=1 Tax=Cellulomonas wangsupingiae TaxID=2968085 RepID=A0ABY5K679_9CELL|nr:nucleotidyltransferase domain-containing protein [Cellulomonas wangsupingiae]MCC2334276.1 nucleotidyltransferase domain-containing protein [Cellulomonas wangsupingiae]UUI65952.1 nucleotidyltransferase domain-containing protein [Cellulomonas wangsupingiae]
MPTSTPPPGDRRFLARTADALAALPGVQAVLLGGSRAQGTAGPDSDWDLAVHYRGPFDPQDLRDLGWEGEVSPVGGWGGGVFNGGAWLRVDGRAVDVHYRDLDVVEREVVRAGRGEFDVEPLMFHVAGIPTYLVVAELALGRVLRGEAPRVEGYPDALRRAAPGVWADRADATLAYARRAHAERGAATACLGLVAVAAHAYAHAVLARRATWATNDKRLLAAAGLDGLDGVVAAAGRDAASLVATVDEVRRHARAVLDA